MPRIVLSEAFRRTQGMMPIDLQRMIDGGAGPEGLHPQAIKISGWLRHHATPEKGEEMLFEFLLNGGRSEREARSEAKRLIGKWKDAATTSRFDRKRDVKQNVQRIRSIVASSSASVNDFKRITLCPVDPDDKYAADDIVNQLFPNGEIIWISYNGKSGSAHPWKQHLGRMEGRQFICPSPMRVAGDYEWDKERECSAFSPRCKANVLYRRWLVLEWDTKPVQKDNKTPSFWAPLIAEWKAEEISTADAQTRLIAEMFGREFGLGMVVHSGNESLHSWWAVAGQDESRIENFINYAQAIGTDTTVARDVSHYVRMPHGKRPGGRRQTVLYLDPKIVKGNER